MKTVKPSVALAAMIALSALPNVGLHAQTAPAKPAQKPMAETMASATGEIVKLTTESIEIKDSKGRVEMYVITAETKYGSKMKPMKHGDFKMGEHVMVKYEKKNGKMMAMAIHHAKPPKTEVPPVPPVKK